MLEHTKRQDKAFFLSRNAFIFPYVYHRGLLFVSSQATHPRISQIREYPPPPSPRAFRASMTRRKLEGDMLGYGSGL